MSELREFVVRCERRADGLWRPEAAVSPEWAHEVVRCRDCKHNMGRYCALLLCKPKPESFCSWGER